MPATTGRRTDVCLPRVQWKKSSPQNIHIRAGPSETARIHPGHVSTAPSSPQHRSGGGPLRRAAHCGVQSADRLAVPGGQLPRSVRYDSATRGLLRICRTLSAGPRGGLDGCGHLRVGERARRFPALPRPKEAGVIDNAVFFTAVVKGMSTLGGAGEPRDVARHFPCQPGGHPAHRPGLRTPGHERWRLVLKRAGPHPRLRVGTLVRHSRPALLEGEGVSHYGDGTEEIEHSTPCGEGSRHPGVREPSGRGPNRHGRPSPWR